MGTQLALPAGWARNFGSLPDPRDRLDQLMRDQLDAKARIRLILDELAEAHSVPARNIDQAMRGVEDSLSDLLYEIKRGYEHEIEEADAI